MILERFKSFCEAHSVKAIQHFTPQFFREFFFSLEQKGLNLGGLGVYYRCLSAWLHFYELELDIETNHWSRMLKKAKPDTPHNDVFETATPEQVKILIDTCQKNRWEGVRDILIIYLLYECGFRAQELTDVKIGDVLNDGIIIRHGKGDKRRVVGFGDITRRHIRRWEKVRNREVEWFLHTRSGKKLNYVSLREILRRACARAKIPMIPLHGFRRAFASALHRKNTDVHTIKNLLGHSDLSVTQRYLKQTDQDVLEKFHSNVDDMYHQNALRTIAKKP